MACFCVSLASVWHPEEWIQVSYEPLPACPLWGQTQSFPLSLNPPLVIQCSRLQGKACSLLGSLKCRWLIPSSALKWCSIVTAGSLLLGSSEPNRPQLTARNVVVIHFPACWAFIPSSNYCTAQYLLTTIPNHCRNVVEIGIHFLTGESYDPKPKLFPLTSQQTPNNHPAWPNRRGTVSPINGSYLYETRLLWSLSWN